MGHDQQIEPVTLNYASSGPGEVHGRFTPILATVFFVLLFSFVGLSLLPYSCPRGRAMTDLTRANMGNLTSPLELYHQHIGAYPAALDDLHRLPPGMTQEAWGGPYVSNSNHLKDAWGQVFQYKAPGMKNAERYDIWSIGADGVSGTKDDICNW